MMRGIDNIGICTAEGDSSTINQWLVREGQALNFDPYARGRYQRDQASARENLWHLERLLRRTLGISPLAQAHGPAVIRIARRSFLEAVRP